MTDVTGGTACLGVLLAILILIGLTQLPWERMVKAFMEFLFPNSRGVKGVRKKKKLK